MEFTPELLNKNKDKLYFAQKKFRGGSIFLKCFNPMQSIIVILIDGKYYNLCANGIAFDQAPEEESKLVRITKIDKYGVDTSKISFVRHPNFNDRSVFWIEDEYEESFESIFNRYINEDLKEDEVGITCNL